MWFFKKKDKAPGQQQAEPQTVVEAVIEAAAPAPQEHEENTDNWFGRLKKGLSASSRKLTGGITDIFTKRKLDDETLEELEELLITADIGVATAGKLVEGLRKSRFGKDVTGEEVRLELARAIAAMIRKAEKEIDTQGKKPFVILVSGVNGAGKTTTIGKLAAHYIDEGKSVMLAAGDTFRAAAVEQLQVWAERAGASFVRKEEGADAAALAYEAMEKAQAQNVDVLMIDTAGRLQNKANLMEELSKVARVIAKKDATAPHAGLLVLDATVGQNAINQVEIFKSAVPITGLVVTKLDGTAKGGVLVSLVERFGLPVHAIGVGEGIDDLRPFTADDFAAGLMGIDAAQLKEQETEQA